MENLQPTLGQETSNLPDKSLEYERLSAVYAEARTEIRQRITQRDQYSIQMTLGLATIVAIASTANPDAQSVKLYRVILAAPIVAIYYTVLIQYSYAVHKVLASLIRQKLEPRLAEICGSKKEFELENYYFNHRVPGIRKLFFVSAMWTVTLCSGVLMVMYIPPKATSR